MNIYFVLKIHYQVKDEEDADEESDATGKTKFSRRGQAQNQNNAGAADFGLGGLSGLKVDRKEIVDKDFRVMKRVYTSIQNYSKRSTMLI